MNPDHFTIRVQLRKPDGTHVIKTWVHKGLFVAQSRALNHFEDLVSRLKPESLEKPVSIDVWYNGQVIRNFKTESW